MECTCYMKSNANKQKQLITFYLVKFNYIIFWNLLPSSQISWIIALKYLLNTALLPPTGYLSKQQQQQNKLHVHKKEHLW